VSVPPRALLSCAAAFLEQGRLVDRLSRPLTASALVAVPIASAGPVQPRWVLVGLAAAVAVAGLAEMYFAFRVGFDATLFRHVSDPGGSDFAATDAALTELGFVPAGKCGRPAQARIAGARRLFRFQILALAAQLLSLATGATIAVMWR
jgi:hypothetical protein